MIFVLSAFCTLSHLQMFGPRHVETQSLISFYWDQPYTPPEVPGRLTQNKWEGVSTKFLSSVWSMGVFIIQNMQVSLSVPNHSPLSVAILRSVSYKKWDPDTMYLVDCQNDFLLVRKFSGTKRCVSEHSICVTGAAVTWSENFWNMPCSEANINNKSMNQGWKMCQVTMYKNHFSLTSLLYFWPLLMRARLSCSCQPFCFSFPSAGIADKQHHATVTWFWFWQTFPRLWRMFAEDTIAWLGGLILSLILGMRSVPTDLILCWRCEWVTDVKELMPINPRILPCLFFYILFILLMLS